VIAQHNDHIRQRMLSLRMASAVISRPSLVYVSFVSLPFVSFVSFLELQASKFRLLNVVFSLYPYSEGRRSKAYKEESMRWQ
jgi:hypothetical protein